MIEVAVLLSSGERVEEHDLSLYHMQADGTVPVAPEDLPTTLTLEQVERIHIARVLEEQNYSRIKTAESLGISKKTLYLKIKEYGIPVPD